MTKKSYFGNSKPNKVCVLVRSPLENKKEAKFPVCIEEELKQRDKLAEVKDLKHPKQIRVSGAFSITKF